MRRKHPLYPLTFTPVLKDYIWGGRSLARRLDRKLPSGANIAESWEIAAHENGDVSVSNGPLRGWRLATLLEDLGLDLVGWRAKWALERDKFPLLIKLLDAHRKLSVQVHPDDAYAAAHEVNELGKSEMWVVLHADPDAAVILGVTAGTTRERFRQAIAAGNLEPHLHRLRVRAGDFICVPSGSLHAILGGLLIAEIQQNSDITYRVYDWNRMGHDGNPRPLHVEQALAVINFDQVEPSLPRARPLDVTGAVRRWELCSNQYFVVERVAMDAGATFAGSCDGQSMEIWGTLSGRGTVAGSNYSVDLTGVRFTLLPAALGPFTVGASSASIWLRVYLP